MALHDALTGLATRLLRSRAGVSLWNTQAAAHAPGGLMVDLDRFKG